MILEFVQGAVQQIGRFVGGLPRAFGWSGQGGATSPSGLVCGSAAISPRILGTAALTSRVEAAAALAPSVAGKAALEEC